MGNVLACCTLAEREANDDAIYPPQEIEQPVLAVDQNPTSSDFTDSEDFCPHYYEHHGIKRRCDSISDISGSTGTSN